MEYPYGYCGMPCALCSRNRVEGTSRCPGCSCDGYYTDMCRVHKCCRERALAHCGLCAEFPCARLGRLGDFSDLTTDNAKERTCAKVKAEGLDAWRAEYAERADMLSLALSRYNDGRMKRFLCETFIRRDLSALRELMARADSLSGTRKELAKQFRALAEEAFASRRADTELP